MTRDTFNFQEEYDDYMRDTPLEARFDPLTIQVLVTEGIAKHAAYGMFLDDYLKQRGRFMEYDDTEKKRLSFYLPLFPAMVSADYAIEFGTSYHRFVTSVIELGLITFQYDYHEQYSEIRDAKQSLLKIVTSNTRKIHYLQIDKQKICTGACDNARRGSSKHFTPNVPEWLYNAVSDCSTYINMSMSDFAYLCWCIGMSSSIPENLINPMVESENRDILGNFNIEFDIYSNRIKRILSDINACL